MERESFDSTVGSRAFRLFAELVRRFHDGGALVDEAQRCDLRAKTYARWRDGFYGLRVRTVANGSDRSFSRGRRTSRKSCEALTSGGMATRPSFWKSPNRTMIAAAGRSDYSCSTRLVTFPSTLLKECILMCTPTVRPTTAGSTCSAT
jgi:hypothetical protein